VSNIRYRRCCAGVRFAAFFTFFLFVSSANAAPRAKLIEFWDDSEPTSIMQVNHDDWQEILTAYIDDQHPSGVNRFDYSAVTAGDARKIKSYIGYMQKLEPRQLNSEEAKAYWINLYNAILVDQIIDTFQSGSNRAVNRLKRGGLRSMGLGREVAEVAMQEISLNDIEHGILRPIWKDPRIHFAISPCTLGGASIQKTAFNGENNEELLEKSRADFFGHSRSVSVGRNRIVLNSVFDWYAADFASNKQELLAYVRENVGEGTRQAIQGLSRISYEYNWDLNTPDAELETGESE